MARNIDMKGISNLFFEYMRSHDGLLHLGQVQVSQQNIGNKIDDFSFLTVAHYLVTTGYISRREQPNQFMWTQKGQHWKGYEQELFDYKIVLDGTLSKNWRDKYFWIYLVLTNIATAMLAWFIAKATAK